MQNKAKVKIGKMNLTLYQKTPYEQNTSPDYGKSPKTKPNKAKVKMGKMNLTLYHEKDYKKRPLDSPKNKPKQTQSGLFAEAPCPPKPWRRRMAKAKPSECPNAL